MVLSALSTLTLVPVLYAKGLWRAPAGKRKGSAD
jgi:hypothetical protein